MFYTILCTVLLRFYLRFEFNTILDPPPIELLLYSNAMVMELIDNLGDEFDEVLIMEKAKPKPQLSQPTTGKPKPKKDQNKDDDKEKKENKNDLLQWVGGCMKKMF